MSLKINALAGRIAVAGITLAQAQALISGVITLIDAVDDIYDGLKGSEKFEAVKAGAKTLAEDLKLDDDFERLWRTLGPIVSMIVSVMKLRGLFTKAPVVSSTTVVSSIGGVAPPQSAPPKPV